MMVNKEKLRIMIDLARQDKALGKKNHLINSYYRIDYVGRYMMGSFLSYTVCFIVFFIGAILFKFDVLANEPDILKILEMFKPYVMYYVAGLIIYEVIVIVVYSVRYSRGNREIRSSTAKLRRLQRLG